MRQSQFMEEVLPSVFKEMQLLGVTSEELIKAYESFNKQTS
jgi:hypothetical protein